MVKIVVWGFVVFVEGGIIVVGIVVVFLSVEVVGVVDVGCDVVGFWVIWGVWVW